MGRTFHVKRSEKTNHREPLTPEEWRRHKRAERKLSKTLLGRMLYASDQYKAAKEAGNTPRTKKFLKILDRTQSKFAKLIEGS